MNKCTKFWCNYSRLSCVCFKWWVWELLVRINWRMYKRFNVLNLMWWVQKRSLSDWVLCPVWKVILFVFVLGSFLNIYTYYYCDDLYGLWYHYSLLRIEIVLSTETKWKYPTFSRFTFVQVLSGIKFILLILELKAFIFAVVVL